MKAFDHFNIDTYNIKQYEGKRVVSEVFLIETPQKYKRNVLAYVSKLRANCLVPISELKKTHP